MKLSIVVLFSAMSIGLSLGQVCSPPGQLCTRSADCCKGCCEAHTCVDRNFACSTDLVPQPGYNSCIGYYCPSNQICYLRDVCPPENPCPPQPMCRKVDMVSNYSIADWQSHNSNQRTSAGPMHCYISIIGLTLRIMRSMIGET